MTKRILSAHLALVALATSALAQTTDTARLTNHPAVPAQPTNPVATDGELSLDELRDMGPLHALAKAPAHRWFEAGAGVETYYTDNAALLEQKTWADVSVLSAHAGVSAKPIRTGVGAVSFVADYDYSAFFYGNLSGRTNHDIGGSIRKIDQLDFQAHSGTLAAEWKNKGWSASTGVRYAAYFNTDTNDREYSEAVPFVRASHRFMLSDEDILDLGADAGYRFTDTPLPSIASSLGSDLNDRFDLGVSVAYTRLIGESWFAQAAYRYGYSQYTQGGSTLDAGAGRADHTHLAMLTLGYAPKSWLLLRAYTSWQARDTDEAVVADYRTLNCGLGASVTVKF